MGVVGVGLMAWLLNPRAWLALALAALLGYHFYALGAAEKRGYAAGDKAGAARVQAQWDAEREALRAAADQAEKVNAEKKEAQHAQVNTATTERAAAARTVPAELSAARTERDRLRHALDIALNTIRSCGDVPTTAEDARAARSAAVAAVLDDMAREAEGLARAATGHAADSLMYQRGWPK